MSERFHPTLVEVYEQKTPLHVSAASLLVAAVIEDLRSISREVADLAPGYRAYPNRIDFAVTELELVAEVLG